MDSTNPLIPTLIGSGIVGLIITILLAIVAFIISAFITSLWIRLIITFMRGALDREYGHMRMASGGYAGPEISPPPANQRPRDV